MDNDTGVTTQIPTLYASPPKIQIASGEIAMHPKQTIHPNSVIPGIAELIFSLFRSRYTSKNQGCHASQIAFVITLIRMPY